MTKYERPARVVLTFVVAALSATVATVDVETVRIVGGILLAGFAAVGIIPPQLSTQTVVHPPSEK